MSVLDKAAGILPRPLTALLAVTCVALGVVLTLRPFTSVEVLTIVAGISAVVTGLSAIVAGRDRPAHRRIGVGVGWLLVGVVILAWPDLTTEHVALIVGVALVVVGVVHAVDAVRSARTARGLGTATAIIGATATVALGVVALAWPDITVFVVSILFGAYIVWFGISTLVAVIRNRQRHNDDAVEQPPAPSTPLRLLRLGGQSIALVLSLILVAVSIATHRGDDTDPFYATPDPIPSPAGTLIRATPLTPADLPAGAQAWLILYSTTDSHGEPAVASASVLTAIEGPDGPRPVIAWTHGTTGVAQACAPTLGTNAFPGMPPLQPALDAGWIIVSTDYFGMGTEGVAPYLIGGGQAHSALDSIRAVQQFTEVDASEQTVVWGHSQGGHAALWTGLLAPDYAPELQILGVASLSPATDLVAMARDVQGRLGGALLTAYVMASYTGTYPEIDPRMYIRPGAWANVQAAATRCVTDASVLASVVTSLPATQPVTLADPASGPMGVRLRENTPTVPTQPVFIGQGTSDEVIPFGITEEWVAQQCRAGAEFEFRAYPDRTHLGVLEPDSPLVPDLMTWTKARLAGEPPTPNC